MDGSQQDTLLASGGSADVLNEILSGLKLLQKDQTNLALVVEKLDKRISGLNGGGRTREDFSSGLSRVNASPGSLDSTRKEQTITEKSLAQESEDNVAPLRRASATSKIILTSYPGQVGVDPLNMNWGHSDPAQRGPVVVSRQGNTIRRRNGKIYPPLLILVLIERTSRWCSWWFVRNIPCLSDCE